MRRRPRAMMSCSATHPTGRHSATRSDGRLTAAFGAGTTDPAALLMLESHRLTKPGGWNGMIVPKAFTYASNWSRVRSLLLDDLTALVDAGKAWPDVKLEQVLYFLRKGQPSLQYASAHRHQEHFRPGASVPKSLCAEFSFLILGIEPKDLVIARKLLRGGLFIADFMTNVRGVLLRDSPNPRGGTLRIIGGKQVQRYRLLGQKGFMRHDPCIPWRATATPGSILVQNIVAHVQNPRACLKIIGTVVKRAEAKNLVLLDTVNQLGNLSSLSSYFLLGLLHSRLISWYVYHFIFAGAIRTMHFDGPVTKRIPVPQLDVTKSAGRKMHDQIVSVVQELRLLHEQQDLASTGQGGFDRPIVRAEQKLNGLIYQLFELSTDEIAHVEGS